MKSGLESQGVLGLASRKRVVAGDRGKVPRVVQGKYAYVVSAPDLEPVDAAIRGDEPGCLLRMSINCAEEIEGEITNGSRVGKDSHTFTWVRANNVNELRRRPAKEVTVALAVRDHVVNVAVNECVIILRVSRLGFVKS